MATLNIMSWNIESVSEKSLVIKYGLLKADLSKIIAQLVKANAINLLMIMEVSPNSATEIGRAVSEELNAMEGTSSYQWVRWASDPTGKDVPLPDEIPVSRFPKSCDKKDYYTKFSTGAETPMYAAYDEVTALQTGQKIWRLKPGRDKRKDWEVKHALLLCGLSRHDIETYLCFFRYDTHPQTNQYLYWNSSAGVGWSISGTGLRSCNANGAELGYQDPNTLFNGRTPMLNQMFTGSIAAPSYFSVIEYHAPFGASIGPRVIASNNLSNLAGLSGVSPGVPTNMQNAPLAIICGDFNVDYDLDPYHGIRFPIPGNANNSTRTYGYFVANGFQLAIREKSSLKTVRGANPSWIDPVDYRASAYDNIVIRPNAAAAITASGVLDMINLLSQPANANALLGWKFIGPNPVYESFVFYRQKISDHLPAIARISI